MSELADLLFGGLKNIVPDISAEMSRLGTQGQMEMASALFNGNSFVPYGPGQYTPSITEQQPEVEQQQHEVGIER
jgi:hypothetical protein